MAKAKWVFTPAPDESVDDQWDLVGTPFSIQVFAKDDYLVNEFNAKEGWVKFYGEFRSLKKAKEMAEALAFQRPTRNGSK